MSRFSKALDGEPALKELPGTQRGLKHRGVTGDHLLQDVLKKTRKNGRGEELGSLNSPSQTSLST